MSIYTKLKKLNNLPQKESMYNRFKVHYWDFIESKSWRYDPSYKAASNYFDAVCFKYKEYPSSFVINKIKNHPSYKKDRIFKQAMNGYLKDLLKNSNYNGSRHCNQFLIDSEGILKYIGKDRANLPSSKYVRIDDGIKDWRYTYESGKVIERKDSQYYFVNPYTAYYFNHKRTQLVSYTRYNHVKLTIKELKFYGFYQEPIY